MIDTDLIPSEWLDMFKANLWANTSSLLRPPVAEEGEEAPAPEFEWHCEKGISGSSQ